jgi:hypothetical protein
MKRFQLACLAILLSFLTSCGVLAQQPPNQAVRLAIAQQLSRTQQTIAQELGDRAALKPNFTINKLNIQSRTKISNSKFHPKGYPADIYKVKGTFNATLTASDHKFQQVSPFEVYLGTHLEGLEGDASAKSDSLSSKKSNPPNANPPSTDSKTDRKVETWFLIDPNKVKLMP